VQNLTFLRVYATLNPIYGGTKKENFQVPHIKKEKSGLANQDAVPG